MKLKAAPVAVEQTSERPPRSIESLEYEIKIAALELKVMRANIANNSKCLKDCISNIDSNKQYTMIDNLYITGLKNIPKRLYGYKFTVWVTQQICRLLPCLDFDMVPDYISVAHPIFKDGEMTDTIIVRFTHRDVRNAIFFKKTKIVDKSVYINEQLTKRNAKLLKDAKDIVGTRQAWSNQCKLYAKVGEDRIKIVSVDDIEVLKEKKRKFDSLSPEEQEQLALAGQQKRRQQVADGAPTDKDNQAESPVSSANLDVAKSKWPDLAESELLAAISQYQSRKSHDHSNNRSNYRTNARGRGNNKYASFNYGGGGVDRGSRNKPPFNYNRREYYGRPQNYENYY